MKKFILLIQILGALFMGGSLYADDLPLKTQGHIQFYVLQESQTIVVQPPYFLTLSLTRAKSASVDFYGAYVSAKFDPTAISSDLEVLKNMYPGYKITMMGPSSFQSIKVDLGLSQPMEINVPAAGTDFFDGGITELSVKEGDEFLKRNAEGHGPVVSIYVKTKKPVLSVVARATVNLDESCRALSHVRGKKTFQLMAAGITKLAQYESITDEDLRSQMLALLLTKCVKFSTEFEPGDDFLLQPVTLQSGVGSQTIETKRVEFVDEMKTWPSEVKVVAQ